MNGLPVIIAGGGIGGLGKLTTTIGERQ